jgi:DnaK suppressor protein
MTGSSPLAIDVAPAGYRTACRGRPSDPRARASGRGGGSTTRGEMGSMDSHDGAAVEDGTEGRDAPLTDAQVEMLRAELERLERRLARSERTAAAAAKPVTLDQTSVGRLSRIDAIANQGMTVGLRARDEGRRAQVAAALSRMDEGTYGSCGGCGAGIPFERLMVFPEATTCARCAEGG